MRRTAWWAPLVLASVLVACSDAPGEGGPDSGVGEPDAGLADGGGEGAFAIQVLDPQASGEFPLSLAVRGERLGVAYFAETGGSPARQLRYVEPGAAPEPVADVDVVFGVSLGFGADGEPLIAYLGGGSDDSLYWKQSDLALARRAGGNWTSEVLVRESGEAPTGIDTSDFGLVVGLWPALLVADDGGVFIAHRDVHGGQFPTDYAHSDIEVAEGAPGAWGRSVAVVGGNSEYGHGGKMSAAMAAAAPALVWSAQPDGAMDTPRDVWFARRDALGDWSAPRLLASTGDTRAGPVLAWNATTGFGIAFEDGSKGVLSYLESRDGSSWAPAEPIFGAGSGGWYPALAFAPDGEPAIAFHVCALEAVAVVCKPSEDALVLKRRRGGVWPTRETVVDPEGGSFTRIAYSGGKAVVAYRDQDHEILKLAVER